MRKWDLLRFKESLLKQLFLTWHCIECGTPLGNSWIEMSVTTCSHACVGRHHGSHWKRPIMAIRYKNKVLIFSLKIPLLHSKYPTFFMSYSHYWPFPVWSMVFPFHIKIYCKIKARIVFYASNSERKELLQK